jgi:hypothetical protein
MNPPSEKLGEPAISRSELLGSEEGQCEIRGRTRDVKSAEIGQTKECTV